jgi:FkbM family methyltransferase
MNTKELKILRQEIFQNEIYSIDLTKNNPVIFDVGAHIGLATIYFKKEYPTAFISAFEPNPNVFPLLEENVSMNRLQNISLYNIALGERSGSKNLYIDKSGNGAFSTASFRRNAWNGKQNSTPILVKAEPLSKYVKGNIDLLKIDVEGCEKGILNDLNANGKFKYVKNIILEYHPIKNHRITELDSILKKNDYEVKYYDNGKKIEKGIENLILIVAKKRV